MLFKVYYSKREPELPVLPYAPAQKEMEKLRALAEAALDTCKQSPDPSLANLGCQLYAHPLFRIGSPEALNTQKRRSTERISAHSHRKSVHYYRKQHAKLCEATRKMPLQIYLIETQHEIFR
ncbi:hypothetical protein [Bradyrhizobium sp. 17]|uniref:hypothetical protein n=1 Tax=Bradyrhizobium sp. 17 TaxID=2782649 RepID=UPI001FFAC06F|nr:hypothetical protein [Bradyrhizobium sp. 17]MCK1520923.1 hypothetical protein [Bradyrhizobium sp. 17]